MGKKTKALSGASQDAYFRRVLKTQLELKVEDRDRLVSKLREDIAQLRLRKHGGADPKPLPSPPPPSAALPPPFDPFSPNVEVVVRTSGREAALAALGGIDNAEHLRLLAREQRLTIASDSACVADLRAAIVTAAERRIANRFAAAG
jgi:hypothetical protein